MRIASIVSIVLFGLALQAGTASAHVTLTSPAVRTTSNKTGPCGNGDSARSANVTTFAPGATITVEWDETVDHPGHYRISFDPDGQHFTNPNNPGDAFPQTMVEPIADKSGGHYTQDVTLPTAPCENCTLQLMQIMTTAVPYNSFYFQCADIRIAEGGDPGDPPDPGGDSGGCSTGGTSGLGMLGVALAFVLRRRSAR